MLAPPVNIHVFAPSPSPTGSVSASPSPVASPSLPPGPARVLTAAYVEGDNGTTLAPAVVAPYLTWAANPWPANAPAVRAAGMKVYTYTNPNRVFWHDSDFFTSLVAAKPSVIATDCSGNRISVPAYGGGDLLDPRVALLTTLWQQAIVNREAENPAARWDAVFEDYTDDVLYASGTPCGYSQSGWQTATINMTEAQGVPIIFNGLSIGLSELPIADATNVIGGVYDGCYTNRSLTSDYKVTAQTWVTTENIEIAMAQKNKTFWCLGKAKQTAATSQDSRIFADASFLLTYSLLSSLLWESYATPSNFPVMPESQLVPTQPLVSIPSDVSALQLAGGAYGREYLQCYYRTRPMGPCAVVVNADRSKTEPFPYGTKYRHTLTVSGDGVYEGGIAAMNGPAPASILAPGTAVISFQ